MGVLPFPADYKKAEEASVVYAPRRTPAENKKPSSARVGRPQSLYPKTGQRSTSSRGKIATSQSHQPHTRYIDAAISNAAINAKIRQAYSNSAHVGDGCRQQHCIQISIKTPADRYIVRLLLTVYRNSSSPYPNVPSPTVYDVWFSHNTCVTVLQTTT